MSKWKAILKTVRPMNLVIMALTMWGVYGALVLKFSAEDFSYVMFSLQTIGILTLASAGYILNDIEDVSIDAVNRPDSNLIDTVIPKDEAMQWYYWLTGIGLVAMAIVSVFYRELTTIGAGILIAALLWLYSRFLQKTPLLGNIAVALLCASLPWLAYLQVQLDTFHSFSPESPEFWNVLVIRADLFAVALTLAYVIFAFIMTLQRELVKDIEDMKGDAKGAYLTLPNLIGFGFSKLIVILLVVASGRLGFELFKRMSEMNLKILPFQVVFFLVLIPIVITFFLALFMRKAKGARRLSRWLKFSMALGLATTLFFWFL